MLNCVIGSIQIMGIELTTQEIKETFHLNTRLYLAKQRIKKKGC
jgi:hypothetical protein